MVLSYTGFDVISTVAEETHSPRSLIPRATIVATLGVAAFWIFGTYGLSIAVPMSQVERPRRVRDDPGHARSRRSTGARARSS